MQFVDTHCHIHDPEFFGPEQRDDAFASALEIGVTQMVLVGTSLADSKNAIDFARMHPDNLAVAVGIHPHEAVKLTEQEIDEQLAELDALSADEKVVAIGECGFDFHYNDRKEALARQEQLLRGQLEIAQRRDLPLSFHVRDAFDDFWPIITQFPEVRGILHSFTDSLDNLERALGLGLFVGVNGIATFARDRQDIYAKIPLSKILLETDSPFLTPTPYRGTINTPKNVSVVAQHLATERQLSLEQVAEATTKNAHQIFKI